MCEFSCKTNYGHTWDEPHRSAPTWQPAGSDCSDLRWMGSFVFLFFSGGDTGEIHTHPSCCTSRLVLRMMSSLTGEGRRDLGEYSGCSSSVKLVRSNRDNTGNASSVLQNYNDAQCHLREKKMFEITIMNNDYLGSTINMSYVIAGDCSLTADWKHLLWHQ